MGLMRLLRLGCDLTPKGILSAIAGACFIASASLCGEALSRRLASFLTARRTVLVLIYVERFGPFALVVIVAGSVL